MNHQSSIFDGGQHLKMSESIPPPNISYVRTELQKLNCFRDAVNVWKNCRGIDAQPKEFLSEAYLLRAWEDDLLELLSSQGSSRVRVDCEYTLLRNNSCVDMRWRDQIVLPYGQRIVSYSRAEIPHVTERRNDIHGTVNIRVPRLNGKEHSDKGTEGPIQEACRQAMVLCNDHELKKICRSVLQIEHGLVLETLQCVSLAGLNEVQFRPLTVSFRICPSDRRKQIVRSIGDAPKEMRHRILPGEAEIDVLLQHGDLVNFHRRLRSSGGILA